MVPTTYRAGETIFLIREPGDSLYTIARGRVRIWVHDADSNVVTLSDLGPGHFFSEMAVIGGDTRSANASAVEDRSPARTKPQCARSSGVGHHEQDWIVWILPGDCDVHGTVDRLQHPGVPGAFFAPARLRPISGD